MPISGKVPYGIEMLTITSSTPDIIVRIIYLFAAMMVGAHGCGMLVCGGRSRPSDVSSGPGIV